MIKLIGVNSIRYLKPRGLTDLIKPFSIRGIHSTIKKLNYYRPPRNKIYETGPISKIWNRTPDGIKIISLISISSYLFIFVAIPIITLVLPPLILGSIGFYKFNKFKNEKLNLKRWELINDSTLIFNPIYLNKVLQPPEQINNEIANFEINRIIDAFWLNEQGICSKFNIDINNLALGSLDAFEFNYNSNSILFNENFKLMAIQQRPLYDKLKNKEIGSVIMSLQILENPKFNDGNIDPTLNIGKSKVLIEIKPNKFFSNSIYLKTGSISNENNNQNDFIDIKGKTRTL